MFLYCSHSGKSNGRAMETRKERNSGVRPPRKGLGRRYDDGGAVSGADETAGLGLFADELNKPPSLATPGGIGDVYNAIWAKPASAPDDYPDLSIGPFLADHLERHYPGLLEPALLDGLRQGGATEAPPAIGGSPNDLFAGVLRLTGADADPSNAAETGQSESEQYAASSPSTTTRRRTSLDLKNPASLHDDGSPWQGKVGVSNNLVEFDSIENGLRAAALNLLNQQCLHGLTTVEDIVPKYATGAPDPAAYIKNIHDWMGTSPGQQLDLKNPDQLRALLGAFVRHESGPGQNKQPRFDDAMLSRAVTAAHEESRRSHPECWAGCR